MVNKTEIKKLLYKQKPEANLLFIRNGIAYYDGVVKVQSEPHVEYKSVFFNIPISDMGDADFFPTMDAKLLIRWLTEV